MSQWSSHIINSSSAIEYTAFAVLSTSNSLLFSRALAIDCAASTPMVFPSSLRARRPWNSFMARPISATVEKDTIEYEKGCLYLHSWHYSYDKVYKHYLEVVPSKGTNVSHFSLHYFHNRVTWFCIIQFKALSLVTQFSITHMRFGQRLCQLGDILGRHSVRNLWHTRHWWKVISQ